MNEHIFERFDAELDKLRSRLIKMGTLLQQQIDYSLRAFIENDKSLAELVVKNDDKIDRIDIKIDKQCMKIFAQLQPVASDLRTTMAAISINDNMELIGDIIVDIAKTIIRMPNVPPIVNTELVIEFGRTVEKIIVTSLDSFIYANSNLAKDVLVLSKKSKEQFYSAFEYNIEAIKSNPENTEYCLYMNDINRNLKFIADLSVNIAHEIIFIVDAKIVKHGYQLNPSEIYEEDQETTDDQDISLEK